MLTPSLDVLRLFRTVPFLLHALQSYSTCLLATASSPLGTAPFIITPPRLPSNLRQLWQDELKLMRIRTKRHELIITPGELQWLP